MTNEPKAGKGIDPEVLAAYIDNRLPPEQRAAVEAQLATDPDSYAVLVDTMEALNDDEIKAMEVTEPLKQPIPFARKQSSRFRTLVIAGGALAAAAAIVLAVLPQPGLLKRLGGGQEDPLMAQLVAAVGENRYIEPRLGGGFKFGPLRSVTRGDADVPQQNLALLAAAGQAQKDAERNPNARTVRAWGSAQLLLRDFDTAIATLERARSEWPDDPTILTDLGAAYAARAQAFTRGEDWPRSLEISEAVLRLTPSSAEALFNRSIALEALGLRSQAIASWSAFLDVEQSESWRQVAQDHLTRLRETPVARYGLTPCDGSLLDQAFSLIDETIVKAGTEQPRDRAAIATPELHAAAECVFAQTGDRFGQDLVEFVKDEPSESKVVHFMALAGQSQALRGVGRFKEAHERALAIEVGLGSDHPLTLKVTPAPLAYLFSVGSMKETESRATRASAHAMSRGYFQVQAQVLGTLGAVQFSAGAFEDADATHQAAFDVWKRLRVAGGMAAAAAYRAEVRGALGDVSGTWDTYLDLFRYRQFISQPARRHATLMSPAFEALSEGFAAVAENFTREALDEASRSVQSNFACEAYYVQARAVIRLGQRAEAETLLNDADESCSRQQEPGLKQRMMADLAFSRAEVLSHYDDQATVVETRRSVELYGKAQTSHRLAALALLEGGALRRLSRFRESEAALARGRQIIESHEELVKNASARLSFIDNLWDLYGEEVSTLVDARDLDRAVVAADSSLMRHDAGPPLDVAATLRGLPAGTLVLLPILTVDRAVVLSLTNAGGIQADVQAVSRQEMLADVGTLADLVRLRAELPAIDRVGDRLSKRLLGPLAERISQTKHLVIAADPLLQAVPFSLLKIHGRRVAELTAITNCRRVSGCLRGVTGQQEFASSVTALGSSGDRLVGMLPNVAAEIALMREAFPGMTTADATLPVFQRALQQRGIVHFAGHARVDINRPWSSTLVLVDDEGRARMTPVTDIVEHGVSADLVVLSACETLRGRAYRGEGLVAAVGTFLKSGARGVVGTLWKIDDRSTATFMGMFYAELAKGRSASQAIRQSQLDLISKGAHPADWAFPVLVS